MPRQARLDAPGTLHHVMIAVTEGNDLFRDDQDWKEFLSWVGNDVQGDGGDRGAGESEDLSDCDRV